MQNFKKGFTLIELIVVIAIIAILAAIVMVRVSQYIQKSKDAAFAAELRELRVYATKYYEENGDYDELCGGNLANDIRNKFCERYPECASSCVDTSSSCTDSWVFDMAITNSPETYLCLDGQGNTYSDATGTVMDGDCYCVR